jgi:cytolysin (calcineurin-like family phosphatase)
MIHHIRYMKKNKHSLNYYTNTKPSSNYRLTYNCELCDVHTIHLLVYKRHIGSNNHYIRSNQF